MGKVASAFQAKAPLSINQSVQDKVQERSRTPAQMFGIDKQIENTNINRVKREKDRAVSEKTNLTTRQAHVLNQLSERLPSFKYYPENKKVEIIKEITEKVKDYNNENTRFVTRKKRLDQNVVLVDVWSDILKGRVPIMLNQYGETFELGTATKAQGGF